MLGVLGLGFAAVELLSFGNFWLIPKRLPSPLARVDERLTSRYIAAFGCVSEPP